MPLLQHTLMNKLYGGDIWAGFSAVAPGEVQGWNGDHPSLSRLTSSPGAKIVVDVGVWKGQSTINMATAMRNAGIDGVVIGVDTFLGSPEHWDMNLFSRNNGLPDLYQIFLSNVVAAGLTDYVIPLAQTSTTAVKILQSRGIAPQIVHVDAAHEYPEVIRDLEDYWNILDDGGYIIGDDYAADWPGVIQAADEFSAKVQRTLLIEYPKYILKK